MNRYLAIGCFATPVTAFIDKVVNDCKIEDSEGQFDWSSIPDRMDFWAFSIPDRIRMAGQIGVERATG
jgi:hypothetical protein